MAESDPTAGASVTVSPPAPAGAAPHARVVATGASAALRRQTRSQPGTGTVARGSMFREIACLVAAIWKTGRRKPLTDWGHIS
jgi:hypothetical protein